MTLISLVTNDKKVKGRKHCISKQQEIGMAVVLSCGKPDHILVPLNESMESKHVALLKFEPSFRFGI